MEPKIEFNPADNKYLVIGFDLDRRKIWHE
jgi:hypothetical protein